jgi:hypothetical protein
VFEWRDWGVRGLLALGLVLAVMTYLFMLHERDARWQRDTAAVFNDQANHLVQVWHKRLDVLQDMAAFYKAVGEFTPVSFVQIHNELLEHKAQHTQTYYLEHDGQQWQLKLSNLALKPGEAEQLQGLLLMHRTAIAQAQKMQQAVMLQADDLPPPVLGDTAYLFTTSADGG